MCSQPHDMILGKMKQYGAQANAARCNGLRSALRLLHLPSAALIASVTPRPSTPPAASVHSPLSGQEAESPKARRGSRGKCIASPTSQKPIGLECPQTLADGGRSIILFPRASTPEAQAACIAPCRKPQGCGRQNDWPRGAFYACFRFTIAHFKQLGEKSRARGV